MQYHGKALKVPLLWLYGTAPRGPQQYLVQVIVHTRDTGTRALDNTLKNEHKVMEKDKMLALARTVLYVRHNQ